VTKAQAATTITGISLGGATADTWTINYDHILVADLASYPIGPGFITGIPITACGTHSFTANDFKNDAGSALATNETTSWSKLTEQPAATTSYVDQVVTRATSYLEYQYANGISAAPRAVEQVLFAHSPAGTTAKMKAQLYDGATATDAFALAAPAAALRSYSKQWATDPTGNPWTLEKLNALRLRWGFSDSADATHTPALDMSILEAEFAPLAYNGTGALALTCTLSASGAKGGIGSGTLAGTVTFASAGRKAASGIGSLVETIVMAATGWLAYPFAARMRLRSVSDAPSVTVVSDAPSLRVVTDTPTIERLT
jgi:hypothetical protein